MEEFTGLALHVQGHLKILEYRDQTSYEDQNPNRVLLNRRNAIHKDNVAVLVANAITHRANGNIFYIAFGNGGTTMDAFGTVSFKAPHVTGLNVDLYNQTYFGMVDDNRGALPGNSMAIRHIGDTQFSDLDIRCLIEQNEPFGQLSSNTLPSIITATDFGPLHTEFTFDEIGLKLADNTLLTHVIFTPVLKTASSLIEVIYTLRVAIDQALA